MPPFSAWPTTLSMTSSSTLGYHTGAIVAVCPTEVDADPETETETESSGGPSDEDSGRGRSAAVRALQASHSYSRLAGQARRSARRVRVWALWHEVVVATAAAQRWGANPKCPWPLCTGRCAPLAPQIASQTMTGRT